MTATPASVTDANGRTIKLRELNPADMLDISEAAGDASTNQGYMQLAMMMCAVEQIGDVPVPMPTNKAEVRALAKQIGNTGLVAVQRALFPSKDEVAPRKAASAEDVAKN